MSEIINDRIKKITDNLNTSCLSEIDFSSFSPMDEFLIRFQPFSYQVSNGGHQQYIYNKCNTSKKTKEGFISDDSDLHKLLIESAENLPFDSIVMDNFIKILNDFEVKIDLEEGDDEICENCSGTGEVYNEDYDEEYDDEELRMTHCDDCCGHGEIYVDNENFRDLNNISELENLDDRFYAIFDDLISVIEENIEN